MTSMCAITRNFWGVIQPSAAILESSDDLSTNSISSMDDGFGDLPIAKWLNNGPITNIHQLPNTKKFYQTVLQNAELDKCEIMSIASDLNNCNLNHYSTSNTISIDSTTTTNSDDNADFEEYELNNIEKLSLSLQFWANNKLKRCFSKWHNFTVNKLNILHIKYKNYQYVRHKKILFNYFKKWLILQQNYKSTMLSLSHWADCIQSNYFKAWQSMSQSTILKHTLILTHLYIQSIRSSPHQNQE